MKAGILSEGERMKNSIRLLVSAIGAVALSWSLTANAGLLGPNDADVEYDEGNNNSALSAGKIAPLFDTSGLTLLYKAEFDDGEEGLYKDFYTTRFNGDPNNAYIEWVGSDYIVCPECYLVVKDGDEPQFLFDLGSGDWVWDGQETLEMEGFYEDNGAISHVAIFGKSVPVEVSEPGTLGLLGLGILGLVSVKRRTQKSA